MNARTLSLLRWRRANRWQTDCSYQEAVKRALYGLAGLCVLPVTWLLYTGKLERNELLIGLPAAILAALASEIVRGEEHPRFLPNASMWLPLWRVPADALRDGFLISWNLLVAASASRRPAGKLWAIRFRAGGADSRSVARRTFAIDFSTISPNAIVIGIDRRRNLLLFHQLVDDKVPQPAYILGGKQGR